MISSTLRVFGLVAIAGAALSANSVFAQISGGGFGRKTVSQQSAERTTQSTVNGLQKRHTSFNAIPFRAANNQSNAQKTKPPIQLSSPAQQFQSPRKSTAFENTTRASTQLPAQQTSFSPQPGTRPQATSRESTNGKVGSMAKFVDLSGSVKFIDDIMLPAQEAGVIQSLSVKEGDYIAAGTIIGKIDDELAQRMLEQAKLQFEMADDASNDTTAIRAAEKKYRVAGIEAAKTEKLARSGSKSESDRMMAVYTKEIALLEREKAVNESRKAMNEKKLAAARYLEAQTRMKHHLLKCDFDAFVIKILKKPQEYVQPGEEIMRVARMDKLWVQGTVDIADVNPHEVLGRPVKITVELARNQTTTFDGKITNVALERQGLTRYLVKAEVENRPVGNHWVLQPLAEVQMRIDLDGDQAKSPLPTPPPSTQFQR